MVLLNILIPLVVGIVLVFIGSLSPWENIGASVIGLLEYIVGTPESINGLWKRRPVNPFSDMTTSIVAYQDGWVRIWTNYGDGSGGDSSTMKYRKFRRLYKRI